MRAGRRRSSELPEILNLSRRVYVIKDGHVACELCDGEITEQRVPAAFFEERAGGA